MTDALGRPSPGVMIFYNLIFYNLVFYKLVFYNLP
jgi:hypothetical protein